MDPFDDRQATRWRQKSVSPAVFDLVYSRNVDPWLYRSSWYERRKYNLTVAALPRQYYGSAFEPACSIGELTRLLAGRSDRVLAVDCSEHAVMTARTSLKDLDNVEVRRATIPADIPDEEFDLVVMSEFFYYLSWPDLEEVVRKSVRQARQGADFVAIHRVAQHGVSDMHAVLERCEQLAQVISYREEDFVLDVFRRS